MASIVAGQEVELLEENALGWARVRVGPGQEGWVDARLLVAPGAETTPQPVSPAPSGAAWWIGAGLAVTLAVVGAIVGVVLVRGDADDVVSTGPAEGSATATAPDPEPAAPPAPTDPFLPTTVPDPSSSDTPATDSAETGEPAFVAGPTHFADETLERALADGAASPLPEGSLLSRDRLATARLVNDLENAGLDLTGLDVTIYPTSSAPSFVLLQTDDSTALVDDDAQAEDLVSQLLASSAVADIDRLVLQHSSIDDEGPYVVTITVRLSDLQEALTTGADVFDRVAVQVDR